MVLSNKKLKQKIRAAKVQIVTEALNGPTAENPKTLDGLINLQKIGTQRPMLSKRENRRKKARAGNSEPTGQRGEIHDDVEEKTVDEVKLEHANVKKKKRKIGETNTSESGNAQEPERPKKKPKKKRKPNNKAANKQTQKEMGQGIVPSNAEEEQLALSSPIADERKEQEPSTKVYVGGIPYYSTEDDIRSYFESCGSINHVDCMKFMDTGKFRGIAIITFKTEAAAKRALAFDGSDMGGFFLKIQPFKSARPNRASNFSPTVIDGYHRIYAGNLAWNITEDDLRKTFSDCKIKSLRFGEDKQTGEFKGYAHIDFADSLSFNMALKMDQTVVCGRPIKLSCAVPKKGVAPKLLDDQADENQNKDVDVHRDQSNTEDKVTPVSKEQENTISAATTEDQENSKEAKPVSSKIRRRTCYECGEKGHLSSACPKKSAVGNEPTGKLVS